MPSLAMERIEGPVLVVGASGFVGRAVVGALREKGVPLRCISRRVRRPEPGIEWVIGDIRDTEQIKGMAKGVRSCVHLATSAVPRVLEHDPLGDVQDNLVPLVALGEELRTAGARKMVFVSSGGTVYGPADRDVFDEYDPTRPISSYGINKLAAEGQVARLAHRYDMHCTVLRLSNPYGPGQDPNGGLGLVASALRRTLDGEPIEVWGDGSAVRDYVYVTDVARAVLAALAYRGGEPVLNVGSGVGLSVNEVIEVVGAVVQTEPRVEYHDARRMDVPRNVLAIERIARECGWKPETGIREGVAAFRDWMIST